MNNRQPGCLSGLFKLFFLDKIYDWLQRRFGYRSGSCMGCGCGTIFLLIFIWIFFSIIFGTDWFRFSF
jgi:hypothetical protein